MDSKGRFWPERPLDPCEWNLDAWFVCGNCGRAIRLGDPSSIDWLISADIRYAAEFCVFTVRCPQHVSVWTLRCAQLGRSTKWIAYFDDARQRDDERPRPQSPIAEPFPIDTTNLRRI